MPDKIRIVYFITSLESGGTERQLLLQLSELSSDIYEKHVICLSGFGPLKDRYQAIAESLTDLKYPRLRHNGRLVWKNLPSAVGSVWRLRRCLRKLRPDILHTLIPVCNVMGAFAGKLAGVPVMVSSRLSLGNYRETKRIFARLEDFTDRWFTLIHCKSEGIKEDVIRREPVDPDRLRVIYNGLDISRYDKPIDKEPLREAFGISLGDPVIGMVANLNPYKGHADMLTAMEKILAKHDNTRLLLIGRNDGIGDQLVEQAKSMGITDRVIFAGERDDVPKLLQLMTLLVSASHEEGFSNTILEAMASGLPIVATDVGGNPEQVADGITGLLVRPLNPDDIAKAVIKILDDAAYGKKLGRHGQLRVAQNFSVKAVMEQLEDFYREAIELNS